MKSKTVSGIHIVINRNTTYLCALVKIYKNSYITLIKSCKILIKYGSFNVQTRILIIVIKMLKSRFARDFLHN